MSRTCVVLGAGGLAGEAWEAGVLSALEEATGFDARSADLLVGTSAGSRVGSVLRLGLSPQDFYSYIAEEPMTREGDGVLRPLRSDPGHVQDPVPPSPAAPVTAPHR